MKLGFHVPLLAVSMVSLVAVQLPMNAQVAPKSEAEAKVEWHDLARELKVEGQGWAETKHPFDRLPAAAESVVRAPVWRFSHDSSGFRYRFITDATTIRARWKLRTDRIAMPHMPATGVSGLDLYTRDAGQWQWIGVGKPQAMQTNDRLLVRGLSQEKREYLLYLPLYNGIDSIEIGLPPGATFEVAPDRYAERKPIVFYGTSITQGGCASRPGMAYPSILGRRLDWPVINLGFSGNGKTEPEVAALLAELDPVAYVIESLPNITVAQVGERVGPFVQILREKHPNVPIVLVENLNYPDAALIAERRSKVVDANALLRQLYNRLVKAGDTHVFYVPSAVLLGGDGEDTVDGTHATDLGFMRMANGMEPILREALADAGQSLVAEPGFETLFAGTSLAGWKPDDAFSIARKEPPGGQWQVEDGAIVGTVDAAGRGGFLRSDRSFTNFILRMQVKLDYPIDSGVFMRVGPTGRSSQVMLDYVPGGEIGAIYVPFERSVFRNPGGILALHKEGWNDLEIRMEGEPARIRVWLNDRLITDFQHTKETNKGVPASGAIAFQASPPSPRASESAPAVGSVHFRNIRIKELP